MELNIDGLDDEQARLLDCIWEFEDDEDFKNWYSTLPYRKMQEVESLLELVRLEAMERYLEMDSLSTARAYIDNIRSW